MGLKLVYSKLVKLELGTLNAWIAAYKQLYCFRYVKTILTFFFNRKKQCKNRDARNNLKPTLPTQTTILSEIKKLSQKIENLNGALTEQGTNFGVKKDVGGWTSIKTAGTDVDCAEPLWHGSNVQPKSELTNQIWVCFVFRTYK